MDEWGKPKLHYLAKVEVSKSTITPLGCCKEPRNHVCCLQWMSTTWQSSPNSTSAPPVPPSQPRFLHSRKTRSFTDTTADSWHFDGRDSTGRKHFQLKPERDSHECQQQGWGHGTPGHVQSVCGVPATRSSVSGQPGTKRNSSRAAVPQSQRMERDKRPQNPAFLAFKDLYTPFHTQLSQNTSWMLLQSQRSPGKRLISHTMIWIQALSQTQACWVFCQLSSHPNRLPSLATHATTVARGKGSAGFFLEAKPAETTELTTP